MKLTSFVFSLLMATGLQATPSASLVFNPSSTAVAPGDTFNLLLNVPAFVSNCVAVFGSHCSTDLYAYQLDINFDPAYLMVLSVDEGSLLSSIGTTAFFSGITDNVGGSVSFIANTLVGAANGANPVVGGTLFSVTFQALSAGSTIVALAPGGCLQASYDVANFSCEMSDVYVDPNASAAITVTPEPATFPVVATALGALGFFARRGRKGRAC